MTTTLLGSRGRTAPVKVFMTEKTIPDDVRRFILTSVPSVPYLEAMLLLRNQAPEWWDVARTAKRLHVSEKVVKVILQDLCTAGIASMVEHERVPRYRYEPGTEGLREMVDRVAKVYGSCLVEVTNLIHSETDKMAQHFADAFKWWKE